MKRIISCGIIGAFILGALMFRAPDIAAIIAHAQTAEKIPDVIVLGKDAKLGQVTFNHVSHNGGKYSIGGTGPIACIECHHTAQPAAEVQKHPPMKTSWPADRTTTLTLELLAKDPNGIGLMPFRR